MKLTNTPYDDVFRTLLNDCSALIIPVINEVFGERYTGQEKVVFFPSEHFLNRQDGDGQGRVTDSSFEIRGREPKKYHLECQSSPDSSMLVRFFEYDTQIALDQGEVIGNTLTVTFPHSAVLYLRCTASTPDEMRIRMVTPGGITEYAVLVMRSQDYTLEEIFRKDLLFLLPFYIFTHESRFHEYEEDRAKLECLMQEYGQIKDKLEGLLEQKAISEYTKCTLLDMSNKVLEHIAARHEAVRKGVKAVMGGKILEHEAKTIRNEGIQQGIEQGLEQGLERGLEQGIEALVLDNLEEGSSEERILTKLEKRFSLDKERALIYYKRFSGEPSDMQ